MARRLIAKIELDGTNRSLRKLYAAFNKAYFGNQLDPDLTVRFGRKKMRKSLGWYDAETDEIVLCPRLRTMARTTCTVVLHEMVHVLLDNCYGHGPRFEKEMLRLANIGAFRGIW